MNERITELYQQIAINHAKQAKLLEKLNRSLLIQDILKEHGILKPEWPIKTSFQGNPVHYPNEVICTFKDRYGGELLQLFIGKVPQELYPEQLIEDLKKSR